MKRYTLKYTGGAPGLIAVTLMAFTLLLIPAALIVLINEIEIVELPGL
jgi:hypothetical protein